LEKEILNEDVFLNLDKKIQGHGMVQRVEININPKLQLFVMHWMQTEKKKNN
jgi:hypothetical protein